MLRSKHTCISKLAFRPETPGGGWSDPGGFSVE
jgi:hypothetical protein